MPYSSKKTGKNEITVMKKGSGEVVGHTTPEKYDAYMAALHMHESGQSPKGMAEGGEVADQTMAPKAMPSTDKKDPAELPEGIRELIEATHKETRESRPDEGWRIAPADRPQGVAPYKKAEEEEATGMEKTPDVLDQLRGFSSGGQIPGYDAGGQTPDDFDPNAILQEIAPPGVGTLTPSPAAPTEPPDTAPIAPPPVPAVPDQSTALPPAKPAMSAALTDQDYMDRANKMLGLGPDQQAGLMKLLGSRSQKGQIGAAIAGLGDAIASGGTLGKVNPGAMGKAEELINNRENQGIQGMQLIRGNQEKAFEMADKLEARDPASPLSKWAQKAYGPVGKKIGLNLENASASLIGDVTGKGVEALNTEYQNQLKLMGIDLQKKQVEATIGNQKAERDIAREGHQAEAAKTLADRGILKTLANAIPGTAGHKATQVLEKQAMGTPGPAAAGPVTVNSQAEYAALPSGTHYVDSFGTQKVKK